MTAGILQPFPADQSLPKEKITSVDSRYTAVIQALDDLFGCCRPQSRPKNTAPYENEILVWSPITELSCFRQCVNSVKHVCGARAGKRAK